MIGAGEESEGKSAREGTEVRTEGYPRHTFVKSTIGTLRSRVRRQDPAGILRFCPPGLAVALILAIPPRPSFSLSAHPSSTLSLAPSPSLFHSHYGLPIFSPRTSLFFLLVASRSRRPHAGRDVTRPTRGRIQTSALFFISR